MSDQDYMSHDGDQGSEEHDEDMYYTDNDREENEMEEESTHKKQPHGLNLEWSLGFNYKLVNGAINLTREECGTGTDGDLNPEIFYVVGHTGVIYSQGSTEKKQRLLQGHCNAITSVAYSHTKKIIITADKGPSSLMVVWDVSSGTPRKCIFDPHPHGVQCLDVSEDGKTIISLSREIIDPDTKKFHSQTVRVWDWESEDAPYTSTGILQPEPPSDFIYYQNYIKINYKKPTEFATTGKEKVYFWKIEQEGVCSYYSPQPASKEQGHSNTFTQTVFIPKSTQAVSGTEEGSLVVWDISLIMEEMSQPDQKREIKTIKLMNDSTVNQSENVGISVLKASEVLLIVGATNGNVRFYDYQFRIVGWFEEDTKLSEITSISLSNDYKEYNTVLSKLEKDEHNFCYPNFIVVDKKARIVLIKTKQFQMVTPEEKEGEILMQGLVSTVTGISARPAAPGVAVPADTATIAIATTDGCIYEWNYIGKNHIPKLIVDLKPDSQNEREPQKSHPQPRCIKYSPNGVFLVICSNNRNVYIYNVVQKKLSPTVLAISQKKEFVQGVEIAFSYDSRSFAIMDDHSCVSVYKIDGEPEKMEDAEWSFYRKIKSHLTTINDICFGEILDRVDNSRKVSKLFSIGEDKYLFQYDIEKNVQNRLHVQSYKKIEREGHPTACIWYPVNYLQEEVIMIATDDYKIKLWNVADDICRQTLLGPTYGGPINKFIYLNFSNKEDKNSPKYVAYTTAEKIVGIIKLPLDGNPNKTMGMIAHPGKISSATASSDGKYLFTSGADDIGTMNMWEINYSVLDDGKQISEEKDQNPLNTYPNLLEGGKDGQIYRDLKDFFYYAQISSNTNNPTKAKKLDGKIPSEQIQNLMRALGYYPTKAEIHNMQQEILYSNFPEERVNRVKVLGLETFVRLFINHRPVYGLTMDLIKDKMAVLAKAVQDGQKGGKEKKIFGNQNDQLNEAAIKARQIEEEAIKRGEIDVEEFKNLLMNYGEKMDEQELKASFAVLLGQDYQKTIPESITSQFMIEKLLGFELDDENQSPDSMMEADEFSEDGISVHHDIN